MICQICHIFEEPPPPIRSVRSESRLPKPETPPISRDVPSSGTLSSRRSPIKEFVTPELLPGDLSSLRRPPPRSDGSESSLPSLKSISRLPPPTKEKTLKVGNVTIEGSSTGIELARKEISEICEHPEWCEYGKACANIDESTGQGICVEEEEYDKTGLSKIVIQGKKIFGSKKAITELKKKLGLLYPESFLDEMRTYCAKNGLSFETFKEKLSVFENEIALKTLTIEKMYNDEIFKKDRLNARKIYKDLYEKWLLNDEISLPSLPTANRKRDKSSLGTPEPLHIDPGTPSESPPTTPPLKESTPIDEKPKTSYEEGTPIDETHTTGDVDVLLKEVTRVHSAPISSLTTVQKEVVKCLGLSA